MSESDDDYAPEIGDTGASVGTDEKESSLQQEEDQSASESANEVNIDANEDGEKSASEGGDDKSTKEDVDNSTKEDADKSGSDLEEERGTEEEGEAEEESREEQVEEETVEGGFEDKEDKNENDSFEKQKDEITVVDDNENNEYDPTESTNISIEDINKKIDVSLFTKVVTYFLSSSLLSDPTFEVLGPDDKTNVLLQAYNSAHGASVKPFEVNLNFGATTSYNKNKLRPRDEPQPLVPINPFCHRADISTKMSGEEFERWREFLSTEDEYNKEFNCMSFPSGSRLFVGNLAVNTLKQQDVWRVFRPYGKIVAVNMKQGFGFVQFTNSSDCDAAIKGELHVPLHNRMMELQVSKTHERHKEMKAEGLDPTKSSSKDLLLHNATVKADILILLTPSPSPSFNSLLVNTFQEADIDCQIKHVDTEADNIDQEIISQAAYGGKTGIVITKSEEVVDLMLFTKEEASPQSEFLNTDTSGKANAIRFDNYESISMESAIGWISEHVKKQNAKLKANAPRQRDTRQSKQIGKDRPRNNYRDRNDKQRFDDRDRERPSRSSMESSGNYSNQRYNNNNNNNNRDRRGGNSRRHNDRYSTHYSESEQYSQKHRPVTTTGYSVSSYGYQQQQQQPPPHNLTGPLIQQQPPPPQQGIPPYGYQQQPNAYGGYQQQQYYNSQAAAPQPYYNNNAAPPIQSPYNGGTYQGGANIGNIYSQPPYGVQYPTQPGALPGMTTNPSNIGTTMNGGMSNSMGGLLSQLQGVQQSPDTNKPLSNTNSNQQKDDSTAALFETLARLKNNM